MAKAKKVRRRILWSAANVSTLKKSAGRDTVRKISKALRRSEAAVRYKAVTLKISLAVRRK